MDKKTYNYISGLSLLILGFGFVLNTPLEIWDGLHLIMQGRADLTTDFFALGNAGATLVNGGLLMLMSNLYLQIFKVRLTGNTITAIVLMMTYGFFGKNLVNIWPFIIGSFTYYKISHKESSEVLPFGLLATGLSPLVSYFSPIIAIPLGFFIGFVISEAAKIPPRLHQGLSLFNTGYAVGIIATVIYQVFRLFGVEVAPRLVYETTSNTTALIALIILFVLMVLLGDSKNYRAILKQDGVKDKDFYNIFGFDSALFNAALNGLLALGFVIVVDAPINGVSLGCILIVSAFGFNGSTLRTLAPIFITYLIGDFFGLWDLREAGPLMAMLLSSSLAPFMGRFGPVGVFIASILVGLLAPITNAFHGGLSLLNTGFACGLVVTALTPLYERIESFINHKKTVH